jgi:hypothetical protein
MKRKPPPIEMTVRRNERAEVSVVNELSGCQRERLNNGFNHDPLTGWSFSAI